MSKELGHWKQDYSYSCVAYGFCDSSMDYTLFTIFNENNDRWYLERNDCVEDLGSSSLEEAKEEALELIRDSLQEDVDYANMWIKIVDSMENKDG